MCKDSDGRVINDVSIIFTNPQESITTQDDRYFGARWHEWIQRQCSMQKWRCDVTQSSWTTQRACGITAIEWRIHNRSIHHFKRNRFSIYNHEWPEWKSWIARLDEFWALDRGMLLPNTDVCVLFVLYICVIDAWLSKNLLTYSDAILFMHRLQLWL